MPIVAHAPFAARLDLVLLHVDARACIDRILARNAVEAVVAREGDADEAVETDSRGANREAAAVDERIELRPRGVS